MGRTKNRKESLIRPKDIFQILLFIGICVYMATCGSVHKQADIRPKGADSTYKLRKEIVAFAKKHIGKKYRYAGRSPKGFDCSGFTYYVMNNFDIDLTPISRAQEKEGKVLAVNQVKPGDLLFFRRTKNGTVFHVGLVVENGKDGVIMIHSSSSRGVVMDNISKNSYWKTKIMTARDVISK